MTKSKLTKFIVPAILILSVLSPSMAMADSNKKGKNNERREEKIERKINKENIKCWNKFFHKMLPFSWVKANLDNIDLDSECFVGKSKKVATTTSDTISPTISNIVSRTGKNRALVIWNTDEKTVGKVYYSTSSSVNISSALSVKESNRFVGGKDHYLIIPNLSANTTYYAVIEAKDKAGNISRSSEFQFTTKLNTPTVDTTSPLISSINSVVGTSTLVVNWNTNESATSKVYYATSTPISTSTAAFVQNSSLVLNHSLKIENLSTSTQYFLMVESSDASANSATSSVFSLTTSN